MKKTSKLSDKIIKIRKLANLNQTELANLLGVSQGNVSHFEINNVRPHYDTIKKLMYLGKKYGIEFTLEDIINARTKEQNKDQEI